MSRCFSSRVLAGTSTHVDLKHIEFTNDADGLIHDPVILLHGLLGQKRNFSSMGNSLASQLKSKRRIFALDLRNHGDNTHDWRDEMSYSHMAQDVIGFMDKMGLARAVLVGHSMGGKVAKSLALASPDRVAGLVVMDIAPVKYTNTDASWSAVQGIIESLKRVQLSPGKTKRDVDKELRESVEDPALRAFVLTNLDVTSSGKDTSLRWKININAVADQLHRIASFDVNSLDIGDHGDGFDLQYTGDTFLIKGGASSFVKGSHMDVISKHFPNYMVTTIKGCGHWVHAESPEATLALLKKYLDR
jgi:pimeloyl-ACP methyl ester carboxylesterase